MARIVKLKNQNGEFITLCELAKAANISYQRLFYWQDEYKIIPSFSIDGLKHPRYKKDDALKIVSLILDSKNQFIRMNAIINEIQKNVLHRQMVKEAANHNKQFTEKTA